MRLFLSKVARTQSSATWSADHHERLAKADEALVRVGGGDDDDDDDDDDDEAPVTTTGTTVLGTSQERP